MAGSRARRWGIAVVAVVAVVLIVVGAMGIVLGLVGRMSTGVGGLVPDELAPSGSAVAGDPVPVVSVPDGDTIVVRVGEGTARVRVIGIDTPEIGRKECHAVEAARESRALVQGRTVLLTADPTQDDRDRYGRLLRHVALADGRSMAEVLIAGGYGREYTYDRPYAGRAAHRSAQTAAREARLGIWGPECVTTSQHQPRQSGGTSGPWPSRAVGVDQRSGGAQPGDDEHELAGLVGGCEV